MKRLVKSLGLTLRLFSTSMTSPSRLSFKPHTFKSFDFFYTNFFIRRIPRFTIGTRHLSINRLNPKENYKDMSPIDTKVQLQGLRKLMVEEGINVYIVPSGDAHQSEYIADVDGRRGFISGFDGSAGLAIITLDKAALFTDGRYYLQASQQLDNSWTLMRQGEPTTPSWIEFVASQAKGQGVGVDPKLLAIGDYQTLSKKLESANDGSTLKPIDANLIDAVWPDQPQRPANSIISLGQEYTGCSSQDKIQKVRDALAKDNHYGLVVSALDEIAWLFNLRGTDIQYNPVFFSYGIVTMDQATLYVNGSQVTEEVRKNLGDSVQIKEYDQVFEDLHSHRVQIEAKKDQQKLLVPKTSSQALLNSIDSTNAHIGTSPIVLAKALKTPSELQGFRNCHVRDGVALVKYFAWLENVLRSKDYDANKVTEAEVADKLLSFRAEQEKFMGESFATISSTGPNGAIIHYHPRHGACDKIDSKVMYLCDSGGQYLDGTTDVTRTWHFGEPTQFEKEAFTRVLQGVISLETMSFPKGTTGFHLDPVVRAPLWLSGLDYRHGTGHGVGSFLNVHEGPHGISFRPSSLETPLQPSMTVTNEPGYYEDGKFGIRTENILIIKEVKGLKNFGGVEYYGFENITLCPIHKALIQKDLLTKFQLDYLNQYHQRVYDILSPHLTTDQFTLNWLKDHTSPL